MSGFKPDISKATAQIIDMRDHRVEKEWAWCAQAQYETAVVEEARAIAQGAPIKPTPEHLRVLLSCLDSADNEPARNDAQEELPF
jgi:hypothetical protein